MFARSPRGSRFRSSSSHVEDVSSRPQAHAPKRHSNRVMGDKETNSDHLKRESVTMEGDCLVDVLVAEIRSRSATSDATALKTSQQQCESRW